MDKGQLEGLGIVQREEQRARLTLQLLVLSKAGVIHEVLLGLGPCGLEADAAHPIQDALQGLDIPTPELLGLFLGRDRVNMRQGQYERILERRTRLKTSGSQKGEETQVTNQVLLALPHPGLLAQDKVPQQLPIQEKGH